MQDVLALEPKLSHVARVLLNLYYVQSGTESVSIPCRDVKTSKNVENDTKLIDLKDLCGSFMKVFLGKSFVRLPLFCSIHLAQKPDL